VLLQLQCEFSASSDPFSAKSETFIHLAQRSFLWLVEAVHAATRTLKVHDIEFLVQESIEADLAVLHSLIEELEDLFIHVSDSVFIVFFA